MPAEYFYAEDDVQRGPVPLHALASCGVTRRTLVWREGMAEWQRAESVPDVLDALNAAAPSAAPPLEQPAADRMIDTGAALPVSALPYGGYKTAPQSGLAMASMILGIVSFPALFFGFCFPIAIVAIVLGHIARRQVRRGEASGGGMALAGLICGYITLLISVLFLALFVLAFIGG